MEEGSRLWVIVGAGLKIDQSLAEKMIRQLGVSFDELTVKEWLPDSSRFNLWGYELDSLRIRTN